MTDQARNKQWSGTFEFIKGDIRDRQLVADLFSDHHIDAIVHLAAMAGVRVSIDDPGLYYDVNVMGTLALLDAAVGRLVVKKATKCPTFIFASTSSVYGNTQTVPFVPEDTCDRPLAPYAASKRAGEMPRAYLSSSLWVGLYSFSIFYGLWSARSTRHDGL